MISSRSQQVRDLLTQVQQQKSYDQRKKNLEDTQQAVDELMLETEHLHTLFITLSAWLDDDSHRYLRAEIETLQGKLRESP